MTFFLPMIGGFTLEAAMCWAMERTSQAQISIDQSGFVVASTRYYLVPCICVCTKRYFLRDIKPFSSGRFYISFSRLRGTQGGRGVLDRRYVLDLMHSRSRMTMDCGARRGDACTLRRKLGPGPGAVARVLGVQSRASWKGTT